MSPARSGLPTRRLVDEGEAKRCASRGRHTPRNATRDWIQPPKYVSPTLTYNYHRDYSLKPDNQVSILTLDGRVIMPYTGYSKHVALLQQGSRHFGGAKLWYDTRSKNASICWCPW